MSEEKKLTGEEIVKALEKCVNKTHAIGCIGCPYFENGIDCIGKSEKDLLDLIHRLQDEKQKVVQDYYCARQTCEEQKAEIERLKSETEEQYKRIMELEQDLVHADENVFYRECDVALNETKLKNKGALELAQEVEAYLAYYQGESFTTEQILDIIKQTLIEDFNFKEQTNEN